MRKTVVLFDIDGTLLTCGGAGRAAMERAFAHVAARTDVLEFPFGGMTDRAIARAGLTHAGHAVDDAAIEKLLASYLSHLETLVPSSERYGVLDGVVALLDRLATLPHLALGLGTGNLEAGARIKLSRAALWERFAFGGFGSDHEDRGELLACGARRGRASLADERARVVVIGDTPKDIAAARAIGADVIAVATGGYPTEELATHAPDLLVASLADPRVAAALD